MSLKDSLCEADHACKGVGLHLLQSLKTKWLYIGYTSDLTRRLSEHQSGKNYSTRKYLPIRLVYYEAYNSRKDATERERILKYHGSSLRKLKDRLEETLS